ncbi:MAG: hypothetical protein BIFFINMI_00686 [Phycisphaerae bacterium]|nr:hypothetical protein [Phycisphaerae bacterium]
MYYRRLKVFLVIISLTLAIAILRCGQLQILQGDRYRQLAEKRMIYPPTFIPTSRGAILDRYDHVLAESVAPANVAVDYRILARDKDYLKRLGARAQSHDQLPADLSRVQAGEQMQQRYDELLRDLARRCGMADEELDANRQAVIDKVERIKKLVSARHGRVIQVAEEESPHTVIENVPDAIRSELYARLTSVDGVYLVSSQARHYPMGECLAHVVGQVGSVGRDDIENDPFADDEYRRYLAGEQKGIAGIELAAEATLRGSRGGLQLRRDGSIEHEVARVPGRDIHLTLDAGLQQRVYNVLARHVAASDFPSGGSIVVVNIGNRVVREVPIADGDVLALVSYPSFDPNRWQDDYERLRTDERNRPLLFRAVGGVYPPGSIVKPAVIAGALTDGRLGLNEQLDCEGRLIPGLNAFRCWLRAGHGMQTPVQAIANSCDVYLYQVGQRMGLEELCHWLGGSNGRACFGLGVDQQTGLSEERTGVLPTPLWIAHNRRALPAVTPADARNVAIGQGELSVTPLQAADMTAAIARGGVFVYPRLISDGPDAGRNRRVDLHVPKRYMDLVHQGMIDVVNEPGMTAYKQFVGFDTVYLAGKTGSAQCSRRRIGGRLFPPLVDAEGKQVRPAHAWFSAYAPADKPTVAVIGMIEFGSAGGRAAAPMVRDVLQLCVNLSYIPGGLEKTRVVPGAMPAAPGGAP